MASTRELYGDDFGAERMWGLQELPLPDAVGWVPLAPGWYIVLTLAVGLIAWWARRRYLAWRLDAYRRAALVELQQMRDPESLRVLPQLLRGAALAAFPRAQVASLRGNAWIAWLNGTAGRDLFLDGDAATLDALVYSRDTVQPSAEETARLRDAASQWMRHHRAAI